MNIVKRFFQLERYNVSFEKPIPNEGPRAAAKRRTVRLVLCALLCALNFVIMLFGELSGVMDLTALVITSAISMFAVIETGGAYPYLLWGVSSALAILFLPAKLAGCEYFFFAGIYPVVKHFAERMKRPLCLAVKFAFFNLMLTVCTIISQFVLGLNPDDGLVFGRLIYLTGNAMFVLYDLALTSVTSYYLLRLRRRIHADRI